MLERSSAVATLLKMRHLDTDRKEHAVRKNAGSLSPRSFGRSHHPAGRCVAGGANYNA
jgi:hypothetical protein